MLGTLILTAPSALAGWLLSFERTGFFGAYALGGGYQMEHKHSFEFLVGVYSNGGRDDYQGNLVYRYTRWSVPIKNVDWKPIQIGVFLIRSFDQDSYFLKTPDRYPTDNYYEPTLFRFGLELGSSFIFEDYNLGFSYRLRLLDSGIIALYNNSNKDLQYYSSSGFALQYYF